MQITRSHPVLAVHDVETSGAWYREKRQRARACGILAVCTALVWCVGTATAGVRAFDAASGAAAPAFAPAAVTRVPDALIPDGHDGLYVAGHSTSAGGTRVSLFHLLPDGAIDPRFHATVDDGVVRSGAVHGRELVLIGTFTRVDAMARHDLAVLDARSGRLESWAPTLPSNAEAGVVGASVVFAAGWMIASSVDHVTAWRDRAKRPSWSEHVPIGATPTLAAAGRRVYSQRGAELVELDPASGRVTPVRGDWHESHGLVAAAGGFYIATEGRYDQLGVASRNTCIEPPANDASNAIAGDASTVFIASAPVDASAPDATQTIAACTKEGRPLAGFTPPTLPLHTQFAWKMAVVGTHLLVFTSRF